MDRLRDMREFARSGCRYSSEYRSAADRQTLFIREFVDRSLNPGPNPHSVPKPGSDSRFFLHDALATKRLDFFDRISHLGQYGVGVFPQAGGSLQAGV